jgi:uncharacterized protein YcbX
VSAATLDALGFENDRRWMIVDDTGKFVSQRTHTQLTLVRTALSGNDIIVGDELRLPSVLEQGELIAVSIWGDQPKALVHPEGSAWFTRFLGEPVRLVHLAEPRQVELEFAEPGDRVHFADAYPLLVIGQSSLDALNERLEKKGEPPVTMARFRPNIVVTGAQPFAEDGWRRFQIGELAFRGLKPCARCSVVQVDPATGARKKEPLATLAEFRKRDRHVMFGMNVVHEAAGRVLRGDVVRVDVGAAPVP